MATTVHVKNIGSSTEDKEVRDFFSFCGKITDIKVTTEGHTKDATVTFEKETAAKTALLLNNTQLGANHISVTSASGSSSDDVDESQEKHQTERDSDEITQEEKPRARIIAEYLAHGYNISEAAMNRALALDEKHGVSKRFLATLQQLDAKYHASDRAKTADQSYGISQRANNLLTGLNSYFEKATNTPTGQRIVKFYSDGQRQAQDIHNEAKRLAELKKQEHGGSAYKAAGLHRVFGAEKTAQSAPGGGAPSNAPATESSQTPTASANVAGNTPDTAAQIPKV